MTALTITGNEKIDNGKDTVVVSPSGTGEYTFANDITGVTVKPSGLVTAVANNDDAKKLNITGGADEGSGTLHLQKAHRLFMWLL